MSGTRNQPLENQLEEGQIEELSSSDRKLIDEYSTDKQSKKRIILGDYHPKAFQEKLLEKLKRDSFSFGDSGLFKRNSAGNLVLDTTEQLEHESAVTEFNTFRSSK